MRHFSSRRKEEEEENIKGTKREAKSATARKMKEMVVAGVNSSLLERERDRDRSERTRRGGGGGEEELK